MQTARLEPDLSALFQYTSPTPVVSLHLIPRIQFHPGIPVTLLTGSSYYFSQGRKSLYDTAVYVLNMSYAR